MLKAQPLPYAGVWPQPGCWLWDTRKPWILFSFWHWLCPPPKGRHWSWWPAWIQWGDRNDGLLPKIKTHVYTQQFRFKILSGHPLHTHTPYNAYWVWPFPKHTQGLIGCLWLKHSFKIKVETWLLCNYEMSVSKSVVSSLINEGTRKMATLVQRRFQTTHTYTGIQKGWE